MSYQYIIYEVKDHICRITMNRPEKLNAIHLPMKREMEDALERAKTDEDVRVVIIKGAGRAFSTGLDLDFRAQWSLENDPSEWREQWKGWDQWVWNNKKPVIAQVHGYVLAGGVSLADSCDITIAAEGTLFGRPQVRQGHTPPSAWPWLMGPKKAKELLFTGNMIDAEEAFRWGLVNKVVPLEKLEEEVNRLAQDISNVPPAAVTANKRNVNKAWEQIGRLREFFRPDEETRKILEGLEEQGFLAQVRERGLKTALEERDSRFQKTAGFVEDEG